MSINNKIEIPQGTTFIYDVSVYGIDNLTGFIPTSEVRKKSPDTDLIFTNTGSIVDASGRIRFVYSSTDTSINKAEYINKIKLSLDSSIYRIIYDTISIID